MIYDDGVNTDAELRVEICPKCENEVMSTHAEYCKICGLRLYNYCTGETIEDPYSNNPPITEQHLNKSDARFCEKCGEPTLYGEAKLLKTWKQIKREDEEFDSIPF